VALGAEQRDVELVMAADVETVPGSGVIGRVEDVTVTVGKPKLVADRGLLIGDRYRVAMERWEKEGKTAFLAGWAEQSRSPTKYGRPLGQRWPSLPAWAWKQG
jgi:Cu+-exporting ATPase